MSDYLRIYGQHTAKCQVDYSHGAPMCTCGLATALAIEERSITIPADEALTAADLALLRLVPADVLVSVVAQLDAEHRAVSIPGEPEVCDVCYSGDGRWPCTTRLIADKLRGLIVTDGETTT